jgi:hypothetical protein
LAAPWLLLLVLLLGWFALYAPRWEWRLLVVQRLVPLSPQLLLLLLLLVVVPPPLPLQLLQVQLVALQVLPASPSQLLHQLPGLLPCRQPARWCQQLLAWGQPPSQAPARRVLQLQSLPAAPPPCPPY